LNKLSDEMVVAELAHPQRGRTVKLLIAHRSSSLVGRAAIFAWSSNAFSQRKARPEQTP
jgi:hypothetical protein